MVFGLIFSFAFSLYTLDHQRSSAALANWLGTRLGFDAGRAAHLLLALAALLLVLAALLRTWASSYLHARVVYAAEIKTGSLVADGPYRRTRNPLYFANLLMTIGLGAMMSRTGFFVAVVAIVLFCYRLILREEAELQVSLGDQYKRYRDAVPRLWPSLRRSIPPAGRQADWSEGFRAESWYWGFAAAVVAFAITLSLELFFVILGTNLLVFWASSALLRKKSGSQSSGSPR